jgi:hypothetical protein
LRDLSALSDKSASLEPAARRFRWDLVAALAGLLAGPLVATIAMAISRLALRPGLVTLPLGLVAGVAYSAAFAAVMRRFGKLAALTAVVGWLVGEVGSLMWNPGGDLLLAGDSFGYWFLLLGTSAVVIAASRRPREPGSPAGRWRNLFRRHDRGLVDRHGRAVPALHGQPGPGPAPQGPDHVGRERAAGRAGLPGKQVPDDDAGPDR